MQETRNKINHDFKTVDYDKKDNSRNLTALGQDDNDKMHSLKHNAQHHINYIKNRRTGSTDCTNNKLNKRDANKIQKLQRKAVIELDTDEGEVIVSKRHNDVEKISPSPSPNKYDIEPSSQVKTAFNAVIKNNYMDKAIYRHDYKQTAKVRRFAANFVCIERRQRKQRKSAKQRNRRIDGRQANCADAPRPADQQVSRLVQERQAHRVQLRNRATGRHAQPGLVSAHC